VALIGEIVETAGSVDRRQQGHKTEASPALIGETDASKDAIP
jgi:hypothetical protein